MNSAAWARRVREIAAEVGATVTKTGRCHFRLEHPDWGNAVVCSGTPKAQNLEQWLRRDIRRAQAAPPRRS